VCSISSGQRPTSRAPAARKSPVHRLSWKIGGRAPPQLQRVLALSPPRVGSLPCALLRTTRDAAPSRASVALKVLHRPPPPRRARRRSAGSSALACRQLPHCRYRNKWVCTEFASLLSRTTNVPRVGTALP
jgi:hypothetical protein